MRAPTKGIEIPLQAFRKFIRLRKRLSEHLPATFYPAIAGRKRVLLPGLKVSQKQGRS